MKFFYKTAAFAHLLKKVPRRHVNNIIRSSHDYTDKINYIGNSRNIIIRSDNPVKLMTTMDRQRKVLHDQLISTLDAAKVPYKNRRQVEDMAWEFRKLQRRPSKFRKAEPLKSRPVEPTSAFQKALEAGKKKPTL